MYFAEVGSGKPIVWLHGWGCDGSIFLPVAKLLPSSRNVLTDMRGFGKSDLLPDDGWSVADYAEDLFRFFNEQGISRATLVAHSFGCRVATVFAALHPESVERMLLFAPAGIRRFSLKRQWRVMCYKLSRSKNKGHASADYLACPNRAMRRTFVKVVNEDLSRYAKRVVCPVLLVGARGDDAVPLWQVARLNKLMKRSVRVEIEGDHFALFRSPRAFAQTVENFVE